MTEQEKTIAINRYAVVIFYCLCCCPDDINVLGNFETEEDAKKYIDSVICSGINISNIALKIIDLEKIRYRNICRATHTMMCNKELCSNPLGHSPLEYEGTEEDKEAKIAIDVLLKKMDEERKIFYKDMREKYPELCGDW